MYDTDPIASLRKRRVSTDSHDSGASHGEILSNRTNDQSKSQTKKSCIVATSSKLVDISYPSESKKKSKANFPEGKLKKKHKKCHKHGHHHCHKHKHKRHRSGGEGSSHRKVVDHSSYHETPKFAIRSPPHTGHFQQKPDNHNEDSSEASKEGSDQQNSSEDEVIFFCSGKKHVYLCFLV